MNALTTTTGAPVASGAMALIPRTMRDAMELASMMAKTGFLPREIQTPGGALFVMEQAMRWNMSPFSVATEISFIQGKPMFSGKIVAAAVQSSGVLSGRLSYEYEGSGDDRAVIVRGTLRGETEPREVTVRLKDARTNNQHWAKSPDQMLAYHGARVWARRHAPEVMLGVYSPEEFDEPQEQPREVPNLAAEPMRAPPGSMREAAAEIVGRPVDKAQHPAEPEALPLLAPDGRLLEVRSNGAPAIIKWGKWATAALAKLESADAVREWRRANGPHFASISEVYPDQVAEVERAIEARLAALASDFPGDLPSGSAAA